jgi:hypothetical protein
VVEEITNPIEQLICDCGPDLNPGCKLGDHASGHQVVAEWRVAPDDDPDMFMYLCSPCLESVLSHGPKGLNLTRFEAAGPAYAIEIEVDAEVWQVLSQRQLLLTQERNELVSLNDVIKDLIAQQEGRA